MPVATDQKGRLQFVAAPTPTVGRIALSSTPPVAGPPVATPTATKTYQDPPIALDSQTGPMMDLPPNLFPPMDAIWFDWGGSVLVPNPGPSTVVTFQVPQGYDGVIKKMAIVFLGAGFTDFSGLVIWRIFRDSEAVQNYENIQFQLGSLPAPSDTQIIIKENQVITVTVETTAPPPGGSQTAARLQGWYWPKTRKYSATQGVE